MNEEQLSAMNYLQENTEMRLTAPNANTELTTADAFGFEEPEGPNAIPYQPTNASIRQV